MARDAGPGSPGTAWLTAGPGWNAERLWSRPPPHRLHTFRRRFSADGLVEALEETCREVIRSP